MSSILRSVPRLYDQPYDPVQQTEHTSSNIDRISQISPSETDSFKAKSEFSASHIERAQSGIGWSTPLTIAGSFLVAVAIAVAHYAYCNYLHLKFVAETIPQSWNNAISVIFAHAFTAALVASVSTAFTQMLWWYLSMRSLPIAKIDALFSLNTNALNLFRLSLLRATPALWFCALLIPYISLATIFPPGSLLVQQLPNIQNISSEVNTINVDNRGDGSAADFFSYAAFDNDPYGGYLQPNRRYSLIAKRTVREDRYDVSESPCGSNCTYEVKFPGPALSCEDNTPNLGLEELVFAYHLKQNQRITSKTSGINPNTSWNAGQAQYMAAASKENDAFKFQISYRNQQTRTLRNISCTVLYAFYTAHVEYMNLAQNVTVKVKKEGPINITETGQKYLFYDVGNAEPIATDFTKSKAPVNNFTEAELNQKFHQLNIRAMADTLIRAFDGAISGFGTPNHFTTNPVIEDTRFAIPIYDKTGYAYNDIVFNLSASKVEQLMEKVVISIMNFGADKYETQVSTETYQAAYVFKDPKRLLVSYGAAIIVCSVFIALGCRRLCQNGRPASSGGFLEVMCATTHDNGKMNRLAKEASREGLRHAPKELTDLVVRYGVVTDGTTQRKHMAFGTLEETELL